MSLFIDSPWQVPLFAASGPEGGGLMGFLSTGGYVMLLIVLCSIATIAVTILAALRLREHRVLPPDVIQRLQTLPEVAAKGDLKPVNEYLARAKDYSPLARVAAVALSGEYPNREECSSAVSTKAREELYHLEQGLPVLEVMVSVAPLLGLMGTTAALVGMFSAFGGVPGEGPDTAKVAHEIGVALRCTIAGLLVAVPSVLAHTYFMRRLDRVAVRIESLMHDVIHTFFSHFEVKRESEI